MRKLFLLIALFTVFVLAALRVLADAPYVAELLVRFAVNESTRLKPDVYSERFNSGTLFDGVSFFSSSDPEGPIRVNCDSVDFFGVTYLLHGSHNRFRESPEIRVRVHHPEIDSNDRRFSYTLLVHYWKRRKPYPLTNWFIVRNEDRINGIFTMQISMQGTILVDAQFELFGCDRDSASPPN